MQNIVLAPPPSFYQRLSSLGVGVADQKILDLGTGTGVLARQFAKQGCEVFASDISPEQVKMAETLAQLENLKITTKIAPAEESDFGRQFDAITANQCFLYFNKAKVIPFIKNSLSPGGILLTSHFSWLPLVDPIAAASEKLILKYNPNWTAHSFSGEIPEVPYGLGSDFTVKDWFYYDEPIAFSREEWRGRIRACRGVGAALEPAAIAQFDEEHEQLLSQIAGEKFSIVHRIDAHLMMPRS